MSTYCFKIYHLFKDYEDIVYIEANSKEEAVQILKEDWEGEISDYKYLGEVDEGLDICMQLQWNTMLESKFCLYLADVLVVSHNAACMMSKKWLREPIVVDVITGEQTTPAQYIKDMIGVILSLDYSEEKSWEEQASTSK